MEPTPIPDDEVTEGARRIVVGPPVGEEITGSIRPIEAVIEETPEMGRRFKTRWVVTPEEAQRLMEGEPFWVYQYTRQMIIFAVAMAEEE